MVASFVGMIIAALATSSLLLAVESLEKTYNNAGRYPLKDAEKKLLINANLSTDENINTIQTTLQTIPRNY